MAIAVHACDNCGQSDDHPKLHYGAETYHHDCIPARVLDDMTSISTYAVEEGTLVLSSRVAIPEDELPDHTKRALEARSLAQEGTRGDKLRKHLVSLPALED